MLGLRRAHAAIGLLIAAVATLHLALAATAWLPPTHRAVVDALAQWRGAILILAVIALGAQAFTGAVVLRHVGLRGGCRAATRPRLALAQRLSAVLVAGFLLVHLAAAALRPSGAPPTAVIAGSTGSWTMLPLLLLSAAGGIAAALHIAIGVHTAPSLLRLRALPGGGMTAVAIGLVLALLAVAGVAGMAWHA